MKQLTGNFVRSDGSAAAGCTVKFLLSSVESNPSVGAVLHEIVTATLDNNGALPAGFSLWCNDELSPSGSSYVVVITDPSVGRVFYGRYSITGPSPINMNALVPSAE